MKLTSRSARHGARVELQMTSMIDVVFLLLIFFMITSSFNKTERQLDPAIQAERSGAAEGRNLERAIIEIVRGDEGFVYRLGGREITTKEELVWVLSQFANKEDGAFVRGSDDAPIDMAAAAIQACKQARFLVVTYEALEP